MNAWETEDEYAMAAYASLPTPTDTPYRTPSRNSRRSMKQKSNSPGPSTSPPRLPYGDTNSKRNSKDVSTDESISILDPRRFTPTLHANLVSEILSLRRDQEEKSKTIESLEVSLHTTRGEAEVLEASLSNTAKETRSLKRQLALLEGGTSSALGELAKERDEAVDSIAETKRRLETAQKKLRLQEEDADRVHTLWNQDKENWDGERRKLERKVHVAENRLKAVLDEVTAYQETRQEGNHGHDVEQDDHSRDSGVGHGSDTASVRSMSMTNSVRFSMLNGPNGYGGSKLNGMSLADELDLDDDEDLPTDHDGRESALSVLHRRNRSRDSVMSRTHKRNQSMDSLMRPGSVVRGRLMANQSVLDKLEGGIMEDDEDPVAVAVTYVDSGVQYSPPPSPELKPVVVPEQSMPEKQIKAFTDGHEFEVEANQRRKRVHASPAIILEQISVHQPMVSAASQTLDGPLSPPRTPKSPSRPPPPPPTTAVTERSMTSASTQTDNTLVDKSITENLRLPVLVPSISIHPPTSRPATPKEPLLPQYFKDVGCQVSMQVPVPSRSISVQTEEIRVDSRINLLPRYLQPSTISSSPPSPEPPSEANEAFSPVPVTLPPRNPRRMKSQQSLAEIPSSPPVPLQPPPPPPQIPETRDTYPGNNDDGPLAKDRGSIRRPPRISSLFAGFDNASSDEADDFADGDMSDSEFRTALSAPKPKKSLSKLAKRASATPTSVPEDVEPVEDKLPPPKRSSARNAVNYDSNGVFTLPDAPAMTAQRVSLNFGGRQLDKPLMVTSAKQGVMRRAALISNGIAAHQNRSQSPTLSEDVKEPPFPIPTRASSRKPPFSASAPGDGSRSPTQESWSHGRRGSGRAHYRVNSIRKVRSAAALPGNSQRYRRHGSRSPPPFSSSTEAPESPQLPPMPNNEITSPYLPHQEMSGPSRYATHKQQPSTNTANTFNTGTHSVGSSVQATSVVDAIAQTMVGEWMFKYVRRRKSFGVTDSAGLDGDPAANGVRHKRWVWLAPYERAVMWSSKQPTSGSALMGKSGRKLTIQSVLDVKDDNPPPKGAQPPFNRSILILTPARALKFTATTRERHYLWLTALSFLAHSSQAVPEVMPSLAIPQNGPSDFELPPQVGPRVKRSHIRDSIRVAKGKAPALPRSVPPSVYANSRTDYSIRTSTSTYGGVREAPSFYTESPLQEAADPPNVPRFTDRSFTAHGRKRSNTGSRIPPPLSFRGFSDRGPSNFNAGGNSGGGYTGSHGSGQGHAPASSTAGMSVGTNGSSDIYNAGSQISSGVGGTNSNSNFTNGMSVSGRSSIRTSDASARPGAVVNNFFDAVGTMRMEAFISPLGHGVGTFDDYPDEAEEIGVNNAAYGRGGALGRRRSRERRRRSRTRDGHFQGRGKGMSESDDWYGGSKTAGEEEYGMRHREDDPFRGF